MVESPHRIESLLDEGQFLTRLARALVRDEHLADDLIQETWLAALKRPPQGDVRSWFTAVARNFARRGRRAAADREERERSVARAELGPSPEEIQRRESVRGAVVEKVLALPEPYRTVVLLRFFENWKPRRIARETGCSVETIKTRLKRALERLREELDRENHGQRAVWMLPLIRAGRVKPLSVSLTKGAVLLSTKTKIAVGVIVILGLAATTSVLLHEPSPERTRAPESLGAAALSRAPESKPSATPESWLTSNRTAAAEISPSNKPNDSRAGDGVPRSTYRLFGSVLVSDGRPLAERQMAVQLTDRSGKRRLSMIESAHYAFDGLEPGPHVLSSRKPGYMHFEQNFVVGGERHDQEHDITIERAWTIDVHLVTPDGEDLRSRLRNERLDLRDQPTILCTTDPVGDRLPPSLDMDRSREGLSVPESDPEMGMDMDRIYVQGGPPIHVCVLLRDLVLACSEVTTPVTELTFEIPVQQIRSLLCGFTLKLVDGDTDMPATKGGLHLLTSGRMDLRPDEQGRVRLRDQLPGRYEIAAFLKGHPVERRVVDLPPGVETDLGAIRFGTGFLMSGRCVDEAGNPKRVPMMLTAAGDSSMLFDVHTEENGLFSAKKLASGQYMLRVKSEPFGPKPDGESGWLARPVLVDTSHGSVEGLVVTVSRPLHATLRPTSPDASGIAYEVLDSAGLVVASGKVARTTAVVVDLVKGDYTVRLSRGEKKIRELPLRVAGETSVVEIDP